jgi:hypothetical protein
MKMSTSLIKTEVLTIGPEARPRFARCKALEDACGAAERRLARSELLRYAPFDLSIA